MDILFVTKDIDYIDPIGLMTISAVAKNLGHSTSLGILQREDVLARIRRQPPDVVAYSSHTGEHKYYLDFNQRAKALGPKFVSIMGGPHPTFCPQVVQKGSLDAICIGEGEGAFADFLKAVEQGRSFEGVPNIRIPNGSDTGIRPLMADLDQVCFPDRELFYQKTEMREFPLKSFIASRGCPYPCTYCFNHAYRKLYGDAPFHIRRRSVSNLIAEIEKIKADYPLEVVKFYDDIFCYKVDDWFLEFVREYKRRIGLPFLALTRADLLTDDMARLFKEAGCFSLSMSIESGVERLRKTVLKRGMSNEQIERAFTMCARHGIYTFSNSILGLPGASIKDDIETVEMNIRSGVTFAEFPIFHPYPGTELGDECIKKGHWKGDFDSFHMSYMGYSPLSCFSMKEKKIQKNLSELGTFAVWQPKFKKFILRKLIYFPPNFLFFLLYYAAKVWLNLTRIYPFRPTAGLLWRFFRKSMNLELFKRTAESEEKLL